MYVILPVYTTKLKEVIRKFPPRALIIIIIHVASFSSHLIHGYNVKEILSVLNNFEGGIFDPMAPVSHNNQNAAFRFLPQS